MRARSLPPCHSIQVRRPLLASILLHLPRCSHLPLDVAERFVPRKKQRAEEGEKLYTLEEVKRIVAQVVAERENALREEYTQTLQQKLEGTITLFSPSFQDRL